MSQWSKSRDYGNSGTRESDADGNFMSEERNAEPLKTVRCVIEKDFELRRLGCGDAASSPIPKGRENTRVISSSTVDSVRLKNHLEWKKQKEIEYFRKREAERLEEERKKNEKLREEREKRRREKEREEKIREWQEQKAREKEERKREEMMMKALEKEIKGVTQTFDKEKLIHEWIRLKNKQQKLEAKKKAELMKREEEARALRQSLAEISYIQWKERTKNRRITLPKNGYQIFGPKPVPVVKEDWNHDFTKADADEMTARTTKSTVSIMSIRGSTISRMDISNDNSKKRIPVKVDRSQTTLNDCDVKSEITSKIAETEERWQKMNSLLSRRDEMARKLFGEQEKSTSVGQQCSKVVPNGFTSKIKLANTETLPTRNKLEIYLQPLMSDPPPKSVVGEKPKKSKKPEDNLKNYLQGLSDINSKLLVNLNEKLSMSRIKPTCSRNTIPDRRVSRDRICDNHQQTPGRRSRSYDKPIRKPAAVPRSSSLSTAEKPIKAEEVKKVKKLPVRNPKPETKEKRKPKKAPKQELVDSPYVTKKKTKSKFMKE